MDISKKYKIKEGKPNPDAGDMHGDLHEPNDDKVKTPANDIHNKPPPPSDPYDDDGTKDKYAELVNTPDNIKLVGSLSEYATILLQREIPKIKRIDAKLRVIVTGKHVPDDLVEIVGRDDNRYGVFRSNESMNLYDRVTMDTWCAANDIPISDDMEVLLKELGVEYE